MRLQELVGHDLVTKPAPLGLWIKCVVKTLFTECQDKERFRKANTLKTSYKNGLEMESSEIKCIWKTGLEKWENLRFKKMVNQ